MATKDGDGPKQSDGGDLSLSIEESNKLRAKLGLKPLDVGESEEKEGSAKKPVDYMALKHEAEEKKKTDELQAKIKDMKKSRQAQSKMMAVKGLGEASDDEEDLDQMVTPLQLVPTK